MTEKLAPTKIGYLRNIPSVSTLIVGPRKAMAGKFVATGHVERTREFGHFRRTEKGDKAVADFDAGLSAALVDLMRRIDAGEKVNGGERGVSTLIKADLAWIGMSSGVIRLNENGTAILKARAKA